MWPGRNVRHALNAPGVALCVLLAGCHPWRLEPPLSEYPKDWDSRIQVATGEGSSPLADTLRSCHADLRSATVDALRSSLSHGRWGAYTSVAAASIGAGASAGSTIGLWPSADARAIRMAAVAVAGSAFVLTWLDFNFNPSLRAARRRSSAAIAEWADLRNEMAQWVAAASELRSAERLSTLEPPAAQPLETARRAFEYRDQRLRARAASCGGLRR